MGCMCVWSGGYVVCSGAQITLRIQLYPHSMPLNSTGTHTDTHVCVLSSIADSSAQKVRPVGSISGRALLDFSDVLQRSQRSPLEWMPLTLHHQAGLSFCVFVYVRRILERRADKGNFKKSVGKCLLDNYIHKTWAPIFRAWERVGCSRFLASFEHRLGFT